MRSRCGPGWVTSVLFLKTNHSNKRDKRCTLSVSLSLLLLLRWGRASASWVPSCLHDGWVSEAPNPDRLNDGRLMSSFSTCFWQFCLLQNSVTISTLVKGTAPKLFRCHEKHVQCITIISDTLGSCHSLHIKTPQRVQYLQDRSVLDGSGDSWGELNRK